VQKRAFVTELDDAFIDGGRSGVGVLPAEGEGAGAFLGEATGAAEDAGIGRGGIVAADSERLRSKRDVSRAAEGAEFDIKSVEIESVVDVHRDGGVGKRSGISGDDRTFIDIDVSEKCARARKRPVACTDFDDVAAALQGRRVGRRLVVVADGDGAGSIDEEDSVAAQGTKISVIITERKAVIPGEMDGGKSEGVGGPQKNTAFLDGRGAGEGVASAEGEVAGQASFGSMKFLHARSVLECAQASAALDWWAMFPNAEQPLPLGFSLDRHM